ncbi:MAG: diacylglycerol/polyprenol kinase family protein [Candidatus Heimdallarchaeaceae archaeon]
MYFEVIVNDWIFVICVNVVILAAISLNFGSHKLKFPPWITRKTTHIVLHACLAFIPYFLQNLFDLFVALGILAIIVLLITAIPKSRFLVKVIQNSTRKEESVRDSVLNIIFTTIALLILVVLFQDMLYIYTAAVLSLSLADGLAELIGRPFGRVKFKIFTEKSLEGSIAVFIGIIICILLSFATYSMLNLIIWWKLIITALIGTLIEALNYKYYDNITLPLSIALSIFLLFEL